jgi:hypothetical protein
MEFAVAGPAYSKQYLVVGDQAKVVCNLATSAVAALADWVRSQ